MNRWKLCLLAAVACVGSWVCVSTARALVAMPPPGPNRVAKSDAVIVGKVIAMEPQDRDVEQTKYRIAVVQVNEALRGVKDAKTVRVGFIPPPAAGGKPGPIGRPGFRGVQLQDGQDGLFLLTKHGKENFYTLGGPIGYFISSENNPDFAKEVQAVNTITRLMDDPKAALKSKDAEERLVGTALLLEMYRSFRGPGQPREEKIDAEESKQILKVMAEANWKNESPHGSLRPNLPMMFNLLGVGPKEGFRPQPNTDYQQQVQNWLRENAETYRIQRFAGGDSK